MHRVTAALGLALLGATLAGCETTTSRNSTSSTTPTLPSQATSVSAAASKKEASQINVQLGLHYLQEGELQIAQQKLHHALEEDPNNPDAHGAIALLDERLGDVKEADREYHRALSLSNHSPDMLNSYGVYLCTHGRADEGLRYLEEAASNPLYRTPWAAYTNEGVCLHAVHRDTEAMGRFERALQANPSFAEAAMHASDLEFLLHNYAQARRRIDAYLLSYPATPDLLLLGWRVAGAQGDFAGQRRYASRLTCEFPDSAQAHAVATAAGSGCSR